MDWDERLATGVAVLDQQHRELVRCVNELENAAADKGELFRAHAADQLRSYVRYHFSTEERLMRNHGFPKLNEHILEHRRFATRLLDLLAIHVRRDNSAELLAFLSPWLINHIGGSDMEYVPYLSITPSPNLLQAERMDGTLQVTANQ